MAPTGDGGASVGGGEPDGVASLDAEPPDASGDVAGAVGAGAATGMGATGGVCVVATGTAAVGSGEATVALGSGDAEGRSGNIVVGSTYPYSSVVLRMPRWTCGSVTPASSLGPIVPTPSPSTTDAPLVTAMEPRWVSVTDQPSVVSIVTHRPLPGTTPTNETTPAVGARTTDASDPATSTPRW
jgi:hypothetical protein